MPLSAEPESPGVLQRLLSFFSRCVRWFLGKPHLPQQAVPHAQAESRQGDAQGVLPATEDLPFAVEFEDDPPVPLSPPTRPTDFEHEWIMQHYAVNDRY